MPSGTYFDRNSDLHLSQEIWGVAAQLGYGAQFTPATKWSMLDDHTPFVERGIRSVDIIDFDYPHWHRISDTLDKLSRRVSSGWGGHSKCGWRGASSRCTNRDRRQYTRPDTGRGGAY